jgi:hypothetical protein
MLGVNITNNFETYNNSIVQRIDAFFDSLDAIRLHPELKHQLLMFCGKPRMLYYCSTTPPQFGTTVVQHFQHRMKLSFSKIIGVSDLNSIRDKMVYNYNGGNLSDYLTHYSTIYNQTVSSIQRGGVKSMMVKLIEFSREEFLSPETSCDRLWSQYIHPTHVGQLTIQQYKCALAIRCRLIPDFCRSEFNEIMRCDCDTAVTTKNLSPEEETNMKEKGIVPLLPHLISCTALHKVNFTIRHDHVKLAIAHIANRYGIRTTLEPRVYAYPDNSASRPDIIFAVQNCAHIATDVIVVQPVNSTDITAIGSAAAAKAREKIAHHGAAVAQFGHKFIPFALETTGHMDSGCFQLIKTLSNAVPFASRPSFVMDMKAAVSTALAQYRAEVLISTLTHVRTRT